MSGHRWIKFWFQDWQRDPALRACSLAARGLWMEMLAIAFEGVPPGHLTIAGAPVSDKQLAAIAGSTPRTVRGLISELEDNGVFSRNEGGLIFSRRMVRDLMQSAAGVVAANKRWNPKKPIRYPNTLESESESESESDKEREAKASPKKAERKIGHRLPADWEPSAEDRTYASNLGLDWNRTAQDFRGYWLAKAGKDAAKMDWSLTWQGWCRREADRKRSASTPKATVSNENARRIKELEAEAMGGMPDMFNGKTLDGEFTNV